MKNFTTEDVKKYYEQTHVHYQMFWKLKESMGLHYGIWDKNTRSLAEAIVNTNSLLMQLGEIKATDTVLDCGCGVGGSAIFLAKNLGCQVAGITLSDKQIQTANELIEAHGVSDKVKVFKQDYHQTAFPDSCFDVVWAIESFGSSTHKPQFAAEMKRILKPNGKILFADTFKPFDYTLESEPNMQTMLNGWAISDILSLDGLRELLTSSGFQSPKVVDVSDKIKKSVDRIYWAALLGFVGTKLYTLYNKNASHFSRIHYKTGLAQKKMYHKGKWGYYLVAAQKLA